MTSSMITHGGIVMSLPLSDKRSIEESPQLLVQSENIPIVTTPTSPIHTLEKLHTAAISASSDKNTPIESISHESLAFSGNTQSSKEDMESSKIANTCINTCVSSPRVVSPPILSEPFSSSIKGSASISGNNNNNTNSTEETKLKNEEDLFSEKRDLPFQTKVEIKNDSSQIEQNSPRLSCHSTPSPPYVPYDPHENQIQQNVSGIMNIENEKNKNSNITSFENQVNPIFYQNGYRINTTSPDNFTNHNQNTRYYGNTMMNTPLYSQVAPPNTQYISPSQVPQSYFYFKQPKIPKAQKTPYQQMYIWNPQQVNQQQITSYQYYGYGNPQVQNQLNGYNIYNHYPQFSTNYPQQPHLRSNIYEHAEINPIQYTRNAVSPIPFQYPNQDKSRQYIDEQQYLNSNSSNSNLEINNQNSWNSFNQDTNLSNNYSKLQENNLNNSISPNEISFSQNQLPRNKASSTKSSLRATQKIQHSLHNHHHQIPNTELIPPKPIYYNDKSLGRYGIRCVCGKGNITIGNDALNSSTSNTTKKSRKTKKNKNKNPSEPPPEDENELVHSEENEISSNSFKSNTLLVQCDNCHFWLHGLCVNIARIRENDRYICPFCENKRIFCTKCNENMNYSDPLIRCTKCGFWVHKECEGLIFGVNPSDFVCRNCGGLGEDAVYEIPNVHFIKTQRKKKISEDLRMLLNNNDDEKNNEDDENDMDLDTFFEKEVPDEVVFTTSSARSGFDNIDSRTQILDAIPDGIFKKMIMSDLDGSELEFRPTIEKYFHTFAPLLFDYSHEFWRVFKETLSKLLQCDEQIILKGIDSLANHFIYMPTKTLSIRNTFGDLQSEEEKIFYQSPETTKALFTNSESITKYLENQNMTRLEKQQKPVTLYCDKSDGRVYSTASLDENAFIADIPGFLMHTDEVRVEDEGIPKTCFVVTDMDLVIDTRDTNFEFFAPRIRRSFHFNTVVKLVRIQGEIRLCLFAMKMKNLLSSEEKLKKGPAIQAGSEIILPLDGTIPYPVNKFQWKDKKKHQKPANKEKEKDKTNSDSLVNDSDGSNLNKSNKNSNVVDESDNENDLALSTHSKSSNQSAIMTRNQERRKKAEMKLEKKNRDEQISRLTLLSSFYDDSVETFPFILLDDDEAVEKYKSQMEMKTSKLKNGKGKR